MLVIAHRGANREAIENSWSAFDKAIAGGSQRIELDVQMTADGEAVIMHDDTLERTCGVDVSVASLTRAQLEAIKLLNGEQIPFLDDVLTKLLPLIELNVEIKDHTDRAAAEVARLLKKSNFLNRVVISSFYPAPLSYLANTNQDLQLACLWGDVVTWPHFAAFSPPVFMQSCRAKIFHPWTNFLTFEVMEQARVRGWKVYPYTSYMGEESDRESLWALMQTFGVDGLCTNYPREFKEWLAKNSNADARLNALQMPNI